MIFFCLHNLMQRNNMDFEPNPEQIDRSYLNLGLDLNFIEPMHQAYLEYGPLFDPQPVAGGGAGETYRSGHINFLTAAICNLSMAGRKAEAEHYLHYLQRTYGLDAYGQPT